MAEAAGFVLAAFPIILSALDRYKDASEVIQGWWQFDTDWKAFHHALTLQKLLFEENLEELLAPIFDTDTEMSILLQDPEGSGWYDSELGEKVQERLPKSYGAYQEIMKDISKVLAKLQAKITKGNKNLRLERAKFPFKRKSLAKAIQRLDESNMMLQRLLGSSERLLVYRKKRKPHVGAFFRRIHNHARSLHAILSYGWRCGCRSSHSTRLLLERRLPPEPKSKNLNVPEDSFTVLFSSEQSSAPSRPSRWMLQHTEIKVYEVIDDLCKNEELVPSLQPTSPPTTVVERGANVLFASSKSARRVNFTEPQRKLVTAPERRDLKEIADLCMAMDNYCPGTPSFGFLYDGQKRRFEIYPMARLHILTDFGQTITLEDLLLRNKQTVLCSGNEIQLSLTRPQRICIASTLAYSLLQLHSTPWLGERWGKKDILFPLVYMGSQEPTVVVEQPYVKSRSASDRIPEDCIGSIFSLGVLLLELWFGETLEEQPFRDKYLGPDGQPNEYTNLSTAAEWLEKGKRDIGTNFVAAIRRCIFWDFSSHGVSLEENDLREEVYTEVVKPVAEVETYLMSKNIESIYGIEAIATLEVGKKSRTRDC